MKKIFKIVITISSIFTIITTSITIGYVFYSLNGIELKSINKLKSPKFSTIYDKNNTLIEVIGKDKKEYASYEDLPPLLVNALVSIEDKGFFSHKGIDAKRTLEAFIHNIFSSSKHGGSTLTQQLIKNVLLTNEQTYKRKIQEAYLAINLEKEMSKEEIITLYFNSVYFEQTTPGVIYAARRYFHKELNELSLPEMALLAGVVKSASYYNPLKYSDRANERKNLVLKNMYEDGYISEEEYLVSKAIHVSSLIKLDSSTNGPTYRFQSYLDVVYLEVEELLGKNPSNDKLEIYTYLDTSLQSYLDQIQEGKIIKFNDETQQIAGTVINNNDYSIAGVIGGRNYLGSHLYNRAYSMLRQPASTMKPIFEYALASEYFNYTNATSIQDKPYTYPGSNITVQNADKNYAGLLSMQEALGYSKNTCALYTLEKVANKIGVNNCIEYLKSINMMDEGPFSYAYGIGGMSFGVSTNQLAGAYSMLVNNGKYLKPSTIYKIVDADTHEVLYERDTTPKQIISSKAAYKVASTLVNIVKEDYYHIGAVSVKNVEIGAKTGTNGYDSRQAKALNYPSYADKDTWLAGFSPYYTMAVWSGWDIPRINNKDYFGKSDIRRQIPKKIFKNVMEHINLKNGTREKPNGLVNINVVKGADGYYLANKYIPNSYIISGIFDNENIPEKTLPEPILGEITQVKTYILPNELELEIISAENPILPFDYQKIFSNSGYNICYKLYNSEEVNLFSQEKKLTIPIDFASVEYLYVYACYEKNQLAFSPVFNVIKSANIF